MWTTAHPGITLIRAWMCEVWKGMELARINNFSFTKRKKKLHYNSFVLSPITDWTYIKILLIKEFNNID